MRATRLVTALVAGTLVAIGMAPHASADDGWGSGLWEPDYTPVPSDCGYFDRNGSDFCVADDATAVELGVRFQVTEPVLISGVRMYRTDASALRASLWASDGTRLAEADVASAAASFTDSWQDVSFANPVPVPTGTTFVASYYSPDARYPFEYGYFTDNAHQVGPLVALQSVQGSGNGVFCYGDPTCYPDATFLDSNYWVTPLWRYPFEGFSAQAAGGWVEAKAGRAIPVAFSLGHDYGLDILADGFPKATRVACPSSGTATVELDSTSTSTAGSSGLRYDTETGEYKYVWKTAKAAAGKCYAFQVGLQDGSVYSLNVQFAR